MIIEKQANTYKEIKHVLLCMNNDSADPYQIMCVYGYWKNNICLGGTYLSKTYPYTFTIALTNANSISIAKAIGNMLKEAVKIHKSLLAEVNKTNIKSLKLVKLLGFKKVYSTTDTITFEFQKEYWRYKDRWII